MVEGREPRLPELSPVRRQAHRAKILSILTSGQTELAQAFKVDNPEYKRQAMTTLRRMMLEVARTRA